MNRLAAKRGKTRKENLERKVAFNTGKKLSANSSIQAERFYTEKEEKKKEMASWEWASSQLSSELRFEAEE